MCSLKVREPSICVCFYFKVANEPCHHIRRCPIDDIFFFRRVQSTGVTPFKNIRIPLHLPKMVLAIERCCILFLLIDVRQGVFFLAWWIIFRDVGRLDFLKKIRGREFPARACRHQCVNSCRWEIGRENGKERRRDTGWYTESSSSLSPFAVGCVSSSTLFSLFYIYQTMVHIA